MSWLSNVVRRRRPTFRSWLKRNPRLGRWLAEDRCLPADTQSPAQLLKHAGKVHSVAYRAGLGAELKQAIREFRS